MSRFGFLFALISLLFLSSFAVADVEFNLTATPSALGAVRGGTTWQRQDRTVWSPRAGGVVEWYSGRVTLAGRGAQTGNWLLLYGAGYWVCYDNCAAANEVWASADKGRTWYEVEMKNPFSSMLSPATVQDSKGNQWRIQGSLAGDLCGDSGRDDVYMSSDGGLNWMAQPQGLPSDTGRILGSAVVDSSDNIYVFGGQTCAPGGGSQPLNDLWRYQATGSSSQRGWKQIQQRATSMPPERSVHGSVMGKYYSGSTSQDALYVMFGFMMWDTRANFGNTYRNDVWVTTNIGAGVNSATWQQLTDKASWTARGDAQLEITASGVMVVAGGVSNAEGVQKRQLNDVWASLDGGYTWGVCSDNAKWEDRVFPFTAIDNEGKLYVMGGQGFIDGEAADFVNDVWVSQQSFDDIDSVSSMCGLVVPPCGVGLRCMPTDNNFVQAVWGVSCDACSWNPTTALQTPAASMTMTYLFVGFLLASIALAAALGYLIYRMRQTGASSPIPLPASAQRWWNEKQGGAGLSDSLNKGNTASEGDSMYNPLTIRDQM